MNAATAGLAIGLLAFLLSIADSVLTGRLLERANRPRIPDSAVSAAAPGSGDPELQALRNRVNDLNNELLGLQTGYITSLEQLDQVVGEKLLDRQRRESIHLFVTRKQEIRSLTRDWVTVNKVAFKLSGPDADRLGEIMKRFLEGWERLAATTGGERDLEQKIEALMATADSEILALIPESEWKRYRPIARGWSWGLVGDATPGK